MAKNDYGRTKSGKPISDELLQRLATEAEEGFDVAEILRRRGGRPAMGSADPLRADPGVDFSRILDLSREDSVALIRVAGPARWNPEVPMPEATPPAPAAGENENDPLGRRLTVPKDGKG